MRFGIAVGGLRGPVSFPGLVDQVRAAAAAGFDTAWSAQLFDWDALTALAAAGAQVQGIGLGTAVVPVYPRHPLVLASQALSAQAATGNRLTLGIGAGIRSIVEDVYGCAYDRPARHVREYLTALLPLLRGEQVDYRGETVRAAGAVSVPGAAAPSVILAALGPVMLGLAGGLADGTVTWMAGPRALGDHVVPVIGKAAADAGRPGPRVVAGVIVHVTGDEPAARRRVDEQFAVASRVRGYRSMLDLEGAAGPGDVAVVGDEAAVERQIRRIADAGATDILAVPFGSGDEQARAITAVAGIARSHTRRAARHRPPARGMTTA